MSVRDTLMVNQNTDEEALGIKNDVDKTGKSVDNAISAAKEEILTKVGGSDVKKVVAEALNSTLDTENLVPLDRMLDAIQGGMVEFDTPGTHSFIIPTDVKQITLTACGAGGGGSGGNGNGYGGAGGSGGMCVKKKIFVEPGTVLSIQIGAGGTGGNHGSYAPGYGKDGGSTVISGVFSLAGGKGAYIEAESVGEGSGAGGVSHSEGSAGLLGAGGKAGGTTNKDGGGGGGSFGNGGDGGASGSNGSPGTKGGGGGGGGYQAKGGNGGDGYVKIEWGLAAL